MKTVCTDKNRRFLFYFHIKILRAVVRKYELEVENYNSKLCLMQAIEKALDEGQIKQGHIWEVAMRF